MISSGVFYEFLRIVTGFLCDIRACQHAGEFFNAFCFEITPYVTDGENRLEVEVSNAKELHIAPLEGDFTVFGGIYRPVSLLALPKTCITPLDYASPGVYVTQDVTPGRAALSVLTKVDNGQKAQKGLAVRASVYDADGRLVVRGETEKADVEKNGKAEFVNTLQIDRPRLWDGRESPHLYRVFVEVCKGGRVVDTLSQHVGLRYFSVDARNGFMLNGRPVGASGSVVSCSMEGTRPILVEIQALVCSSNFGFPKRQAAGTDFNRVSLLMAVLEKRLGLQISGCDAYVNIAGGIKISEPAIDLGIVMAVISSFKNRPIEEGVMAFGEVGLSGEVRAVSQAEGRVSEAKKLGFRTCILPQVSLEHLPNVDGIRLVGVRSVRDVIDYI